MNIAHPAPTAVSSAPIMQKTWRDFCPVEQLMADVAIADNPVVITACTSLAENVSRAWVQEILIARMLRHPRFSAAPNQNNSGKFRFDPVPGFTPAHAASSEHHLVFENVIDPSKTHKEREQLFSKRLSEIMSTPLDMTRPLWKIFVFPEWSIVKEDGNCDQRSTVIIRVHHSIADGIGLIKFFSSEIIDQGQGKELSRFLVVPERQKDAISTEAFDASGSKPTKPIEQVMKQPLIAPANHPGILQKMWEVAEDLYMSSVRMLFPDPESVFTRSDIQRDKVCALLPPSEFTVEMLKDASRILGVTINDMLYAAVSGASRAYLREHGDNPDELKDLRCAIPFNRHMLNEFKMSDISNQFALVVLDLHVNEDDRLSRLERSVQTLRRMKRGHQCGMLLALLDFLSRLPQTPRRVLWRHLTKATSMLFTNVPGPKTPVQLGGVDVSSIHFFAPSDGHAGVVVALFSYAGRIAMGVSGDKGRISNPQRFVELLAEEIEGLLELSKSV